MSPLTPCSRGPISAHQRTGKQTSSRNEVDCRTNCLTAANSSTCHCTKPNLFSRFQFSVPLNGRPRPTLRVSVWPFLGRSGFLFPSAVRIHQLAVLQSRDR